MKLTQKQEGFVLDYFNTEKPGQSYLNHYPCKSMAVASACATRLLKKANIQARLKELRDQRAEKIIEKTLATKLEAGQVATEIMRARFADFDIDNLTSDQLKSPAIRQVTRQSGSGRDGKSPWQSTTVKLESPLAAADYLAKLYGWYDMQLVNQDNRSITNFVFVLPDGSKKTPKELSQRP